MTRPADAVVSAVAPTDSLGAPASPSGSTLQPPAAASAAIPGANALPRRQFPILGGKKLLSVPWSLIAPHEVQAVRNHSQTLKRLAERGGLSACEALGVIEGRSWGQLVPRADDEERLSALAAEAARGIDSPEGVETGTVSTAKPQEPGRDSDAPKGITASPKEPT